MQMFFLNVTAKNQIRLLLAVFVREREKEKVFKTMEKVRKGKHLLKLSIYGH